MKEADKKQVDIVRVAVFTADTEALLTSPRNDSDLMFFHSKLNLHNFTFFNLVNKDVMNYIWTEVNGEIKSSNFTSCYVDYLRNLIKSIPTLENMWSDGCSYQNKCSILASALLTFAVKNNVRITQKYLVVGHTHMECDSVHASIEARLKHIDINLPIDYINVIKTARMRPSRYGVKYLEYDFFRDYKEVCDIKSLRPPKEDDSHPVVTQIRQICYETDGSMSYNLSYSGDTWQKYPNNLNLRLLDAKQLYQTVNKISYTKWSHLQAIKVTTPKDCHHFYDNLEHHSKQ